jgi:hypothetical protein
MLGDLTPFHRQIALSLLLQQSSDTPRSSSITFSKKKTKKKTMDMEPISSPTSDYSGFPGVRKRKRPNRPNDAVYPGEEKVEIEVEQLENLQKMVEEIESKLTLLKGMIKAVVSGVFFSLRLMTSFRFFYLQVACAD